MLKPYKGKLSRIQKIKDFVFLISFVLFIIIGIAVGMAVQQWAVLLVLLVVVLITYGGVSYFLKTRSS